MDSMFADCRIYSVLSEDMKVYRGIEIDNYNASAFVNKIVAGKVFADKGFMSTSANRTIASNNWNFLFQIDVPEGKNILICLF